MARKTTAAMVEPGSPSTMLSLNRMTLPSGATVLTEQHPTDEHASKLHKYLQDSVRRKLERANETNHTNTNSDRYYQKQRREHNNNNNIAINTSNTKLKPSSNRNPAVLLMRPSDLNSQFQVKRNSQAISN